MRGVCNFHAEAEILVERVRKTKMRRPEHLGVLVTAPCADSLGSATLVGALLHAVDIIDIDQRETWAAAGGCLLSKASTSASPYSSSRQSERRSGFTRQFDGLGGLVQKSELADLAGDDLASLYGAMLELVEGARDADAAATLTSWRQRGQRALQLEAAIVTTAAHKDI